MMVCVLAANLLPLVLLLTFFGNTAQTNSSPEDLTGVWLWGESSVVIIQRGSEVTATYLDVSSDSAARGFKYGDVPFKGVVDGRVLHLQMDLRYPLYLKNACGAKWLTWEMVDFQISSDGHMLKGKRWNPHVDNTCKVTTTIEQTEELILDPNT